MANYINEARLLAELEAAIHAEVKRAVEIAVDEIVARARQAARERIGEIAIGLLSEYSLSRDGKLLQITVKIEE